MTFVINLYCLIYVTGSQVVIIPAGLPRKPGMAREDLFNANASVIYDLACAIGAFSRFALVAIITNPVNSMVPIMSEVLMRVRLPKFSLFDINFVYTTGSLK